MSQNEQFTSEVIEDKQLMTYCIQGLLRFAQELEVCQGGEAKEKIVGLRDLTQEIISFWDLDEALFAPVCEVGQQA